MKKIDRAIFWLTLLVVFLFWWQIKNLPFHWDSAGFVIPYSDYLYNNDLSLPTNAKFDYAHPPLIMYLIAVSWKIFGQTRWAAHLVMLPFAWVFLFSSYKFGRMMMGKIWGVVLWAWLLTMPVFVSQLGAVYIDMPVAAMVSLSLTALLQKQWVKSGLSLSLALLIKEPALGVVPVYWLFVYKNRKSMGMSKQIGLSLLPVFVYGGWLVVHKYVYGYLWFKPGYERFTPEMWGFNNFRYILGLQLIELVGRQYRWIMVLLSSFGMVRYLGKKRVSQAELKVVGVLMGIIIPVLGFFTVGGQQHTKYLMLLMPYYYLLGVWGLKQALMLFRQLNYKIKSEWVLTMAVVVFMSVQIMIWKPSTAEASNTESLKTQEHNLAYQDMIDVWKKAATYVSQNHPDALILGHFPENYQLTSPINGYVQEPLSFTQCEYYHGDHNESDVLVYLHSYSPGKFACRNVLDKYSNNLEKSFETNGWRVELYRLE